MFGLLNIDKPAGITSRDVVNKVQRLVRPAKAGHAGTLDPLATGVLVVCVGPATRLVPYVQRQRKTYRGAFLLGRSSDTDDIEGNVVEAPLPNLTEADIRDAAKRFVGTIDQVPPAHSAVKVQGRRAYDLARRGETVNLQPRPVEIHRLEVLAFDGVRLELEVECGSGTYIRSLGRDLAAALGTGAVMCELRRTAIGPFQADEAIQLEDLRSDSVERLLLSPSLGVAGLPQIHVSDEVARTLRQGRRVRGEWRLSPGSEVAAIAPDGTLIGVCEATAEEEAAPRVIFPAPT